MAATSNTSHLALFHLVWSPVAWFLLIWPKSCPSRPGPAQVAQVLPVPSKSFPSDLYPALHVGGIIVLIIVFSSDSYCFSNFQTRSSRCWWI